MIKVFFKSIYFYFFLFLIFSLDFDAKASFLKIECSNFEFGHAKIYSSLSTKGFFYLKNNKLYDSNSLLKKSIVKINKIDKLYFNGNYIFIKRDNYLICITRFNSEILWIKKFLENINCDPLIYNDFLYVVSGFNKIFSFDIETGEQLWKHEEELKAFYFYTNVKFLHSKNFLYLVYPNNKIIVLKKLNGNILNNFYIKDEYKFYVSKPLYICDIKLFNGVVYICYNNGNLKSFNLLTGELVWSKNDLNFKRFILTFDKILCFKDNGLIVVFKRANGDLLYINKNLQKIKNVKIEDFVFLCDLRKNFLVVFKKGIYLFSIFDTSLILENKFLFKIESKLIKESYNSIYIFFDRFFYNVFFD